MKRKLAIIGLDGVGMDALNIFGKYMPNLIELLNESIMFKIHTLPPYTPPVWTSISTGVNPGRHSIIGFNKVIYNNKTNIFNMKINTSKDVKYPRIWEYLGLLGIRSIVINYPLTYPFRYMYLENTILIPGWDSPKKEIFPRNLPDKYLYLTDMPHTWYKYRKNVNDYLAYLSTNIRKRIQLINDLINRYKHSLLDIVFSELDWIQHVVIRTGNEPEKYNHIIKILNEIDNFIGKIKELYDKTIIVSDHDHHTYVKCYNLLYPFIENNLISLTFEKIGKPKNAYDIFIRLINNRTYQRIALSNKFLRKFFISSFAKILGTKIKIKHLLIYEENIGIYFDDIFLRKTGLEKIKSYYRDVLGISLIDRRKLFWGENLNSLPNMFVNFYELSKEYGLYHELIRKPVLDIRGRDHFPDGIFAYYNYDQDIMQLKNIEYLRPWDVASIALYILTGKGTDKLDGINISNDYSLNKTVQKLILFKRIKSVGNINRLR